MRCKTSRLLRRWALSYRTTSLASSACGKTTRTEVLPLAAHSQTTPALVDTRALEAIQALEGSQAMDIRALQDIRAPEGIRALEGIWALKGIWALEDIQAPQATQAPPTIPTQRLTPVREATRGVACRVSRQRHTLRTVLTTVGKDSMEVARHTTAQARRCACRARRYARTTGQATQPS